LVVQDAPGDLGEVVGDMRGLWDDVVVVRRAGQPRAAAGRRAVAVVGVGLGARRPFVGVEEGVMPGKRPSVKNEKQYEALKDKGMSKERAARIANSPGASKRGGKKSHSTSSSGRSRQGGTTAQKKAAGRKGGRAAARS
jgi:hypothetical protein